MVNALEVNVLRSENSEIVYKQAPYVNPCRVKWYYMHAVEVDPCVLSQL